MNKFELRQAVDADAGKLAVLKQQVWISTYATVGINEEFANYVLEEYTVEKVKENIKDINKELYMFTNEGEIVGCIDIYPTAVCPVPIPGNGFSLEISEFYILECFCGKGIGKKFLNKIIDLSLRKRIEWIWLTVHHKNERAVNFYLNNGFNKIGIYNFKMNDKGHKNYVMLRKIGT